MKPTEEGQEMKWFNRVYEGQERSCETDGGGSGSVVKSNESLSFRRVPQLDSLI